MNTRFFMVHVTLLACALSGCALFGKSEPLEVRYFSPTSAQPAGNAAARHEPSDLRVRVGKVSAASHLDRRIVYREDGHELGYYSGLRWTEAPEEYVRRGLEEMLFERLGLTRVTSGSAPTLEVELVAFEEMKAPRHVGRVVVSVTLFDEKLERYRRTFVAEKAIESDDPDAAVEALCRALATSLDQISHEAMAELTHVKRETEVAREAARRSEAASASAIAP